jgi:hypothetical protein
MAEAVSAADSADGHMAQIRNKLTGSQVSPAPRPPLLLALPAGLCM